MLCILLSTLLSALMAIQLIYIVKIVDLQFYFLYVFVRCIFVAKYYLADLLY